MKHYRVDNFLLSDEWQEQGSKGRISYAFISSRIDEQTREEHIVKRNAIIDDLLSKNDEAYSSWVLTSVIEQEFSGIIGWASVAHFRVRD